MAEYGPEDAPLAEVPVISEIFAHAQSRFLGYIKSHRDLDNQLGMFHGTSTLRNAIYDAMLELGLNDPFELKELAGEVKRRLKEAGLAHHCSATESIDLNQVLYQGGEKDRLVVQWRFQLALALSPLLLHSNPRLVRLTRLRPFIMPDLVAEFYLPV